MDPIPNVTVDPRRECDARFERVFDESGGAEGGTDRPPGTCQRVSADRLMFTCPGCGQWGGVRATPPPKQASAWEILGGTLDDPAGLTLQPSVHCVSCCGWHGYLRNGRFVPC